MGGKFLQEPYKEKVVDLNVIKIATLIKKSKAI